MHCPITNGTVKITFKTLKIICLVLKVCNADYIKSNLSAFSIKTIDISLENYYNYNSKSNERFI